MSHISTWEMSETELVAEVEASRACIAKLKADLLEADLANHTDMAAMDKLWRVMQSGTPVVTLTFYHIGDFMCRIYNGGAELGRGNDLRGAIAAIEEKP